MKEIFKKLKNPKKILKIFIVFQACIVNARVQLYKDIMSYKVQDPAFEPKKILISKIYTIYVLKDYIKDADRFLYKNLNKKDKETFIRWIIKRWGGGKLETISKNNENHLNNLFKQAQNLYQNRQTINSPIKFKVNNKEILYITDTPLDPKGTPFDRKDSIKYYTLVHSFMLQEYKMNGFDMEDGKIILDCGAADGDTAILFSTLYPNSPIFAFECSDSSFINLQNNIKINNFTNVSAHKFAIYKKTKTIYFDKNYCLIEEKEEGVREQVEGLSIDDFVKENNINNLGLIKFDIEGGEQNGLYGAKNTILKQKPIIMIPIYHIPSDIAKIPKFLNSLNLKMEIRLKYTEERIMGVDCILFIKFI